MLTTLSLLVYGLAIALCGFVQQRAGTRLTAPLFR